MTQVSDHDSYGQLTRTDAEDETGAASAVVLRQLPLELGTQHRLHEGSARTSSATTPSATGADGNAGYGEEEEGDDEVQR